jgi:hypothetical protein
MVARFSLGIFAEKIIAATLLRLILIPARAARTWTVVT